MLSGRGGGVDVANLQGQLRLLGAGVRDERRVVLGPLLEVRMAGAAVRNVRPTSGSLLRLSDQRTAAGERSTRGRAIVPSVHVRIVYCAICGYRDRAHALGDELAQRFSADVEVVDGKFGQFDVLVDGALVASRGESFAARMLPRDAPHSTEVIAAIEAHCAPREGEACPVPEK